MKYTCVRQTEQADCGAASLATICLHYRRQVSLPKLRDLAGVDKIGASMAGLKRAAEALGFVATGVKGGWGALPTVPLPAIAHVRNADGLGHFVVLHRVDGTQATIADPARGILKLTRQQFEAMWTGRLLLLAPQPEFRRQASSDAPARSPAGRLLALLAPNSGVLARVGLLAVLLTVLGLLPAVFVRVLVDDVLPGAQLGVLDMLGIGMIIVLAFRVVFSALREYFVTHLGRRIDLQMQSQYLRHVLALPLRFFETKRTGDIMSRMIDVAKINAVVGGVALGALVDVLLLAVFIGIMFHFDARLAAVSCAFIPVLIGALYLHQRALVAGSRDAMEHGARLQSRLVEDLGGVATLRACGAIEQRAHRLDERLVDTVQARFRMRLLGLSMTSTETLVSGAASLVVLWYGGHLVTDGALSIGQLMFFNTLLAQMLVPLRSLTSANLTVQEGLVALERLGEVVDLDREIDPAARVCAPPPVLQHGITFEQTTFDYGNRGSRKVLDNLDVLIPAGRTTAFVGTSGCGKSTILRLLMGFHRPTAGRVAIDGMDLRDVDLERWRMGVSWVPQDPTVFDGSIADNVALGDANIDLARVVAACRLAGLAELVDTMPDRYDTAIGERGTSLSGGQRQLLAIARAIYRNAPVVVFDEATSMLDAGTERALRDRLAPWLAGRTVVVVAHRLATVRSADWIYVLGGGRLIEGGTHPTLMAQQGVYAGYWRDQNGGVDAVPAAPHEATHPLIGIA